MTTTNTATATTRSPKRVRLDDQPIIVDDDTTSDKTVKPTDAVRRYLQINARSLPNAMQQLITDHTFEFTLIQSKIKQKTEMISKFDDDQYIPSSARFNFTLTSSESVMETQDFKTLASACNTHLKTCQKQLKDCMTKCLKLEKKELETKWSDLFCNTLKQMSEITMVMSDSMLVNNHDKFAYMHLLKNMLHG